MCGVIAYSNPEPEPKDFVTLARIFEESAVRGIHAFGVSWLPANHKNIETRKFFSVEKMSAFILEQLREEKPRAVIGHNRYSTSGDWHDEKNNQPLFLLESNTAMAFNGVIDQSPESEWPARYGYNFATENDGEIALRKWAESPTEFLKWFAAQRFSFAGAFLDWGGVRLVRNGGRPLWGVDVEGANFAASTVDILRRSGINQAAYAVPTNTIVCL